MTCLGDLVVSFLATAREEALIVAPFIRSSALTRVLQGIAPGVRVTVVTRWRPADLLAGASDLGVFDIAQAASIPLFLRHDLHAKLFVSDARCLVGSANVTETALGWREPSNLEVLTAVSRHAPEIVEFESMLYRGAVPATANQRDCLRDLVRLMENHTATFVVPEVADDETTPGLILPTWAPRTRNPDELYTVYTERTDDISRAALPVMRQELLALGVSPGMRESEFRAWIGAAIMQSPLIAAVMRWVDERGDMNELALEGILIEIGIDPETYPPKEAIQVLQRWLTHFLSAQYETVRDSIKLIKARPV